MILSMYDGILTREWDYFKHSNSVMTFKLANSVILNFPLLSGNLNREFFLDYILCQIPKKLEELNFALSKKSECQRKINVR